MATSNIKLFDENKVNMMPDEAYQLETQRTNGVQSGIASSQLQNKTLYQLSLVSYAIAQIMNQNGLNANDSDTVSTFVNNLSSTMLQKVQDIATTAEAQAGVATGKWMSPSLVKAAIDTLAAKSQNILSDATKTLYGLGTNAVPDDVFGAIDTLFGSMETAIANAGNCKIATGSYTGTNKYGASYPNSLTFDFEVKYLRIGVRLIDGYLEPTIFGQQVSYGTSEFFADVLRVNSYIEYGGSRYVKMKKSADGKTITWYSTTDAIRQLNDGASTYYYIAIG